MNEQTIDKSKCLRLMFFALSLVLFLFIVTDGYAQKGSQTDIPGACFKCHPKLKEGLSQKYVHFPFKQGKCGSCHDMHASDYRGLTKDNINSLCLSCHENINKLFKKAKIHGALKNGVCTDCHAVHSGANKNLLVKDEKNLCSGCHDKLKDQLTRQFVHAPFRGGECSSCHDPHGSVEKNQFLDSPNKTCKRCHAPRCKTGGVSISSATKDLDCTGCHAGHGSAYKGLLGPQGHTVFLTQKCDQCHNPISAGAQITTKAEGEKLCLSCHQNESSKFRGSDVHKGSGKSACSMCHSYHASEKKGLTVNETGLCITCHEATEKRILLMEKVIKKVKCSPVKDRRCFGCHMPLHSSQQYYFKTSVSLTCAKCHETQHKVTHPLGAGVIDPRNNQQMTCISCHSLHSARSEFMLTHDRKRQLCIQCHKK